MSPKIRKILQDRILFLESTHVKVFVFLTFYYFFIQINQLYKKRYKLHKKKKLRIIIKEN